MNTTNSLINSKQLASKYRFSLDKEEACQVIDPFAYKDILNNLYQQNMLINKELTPIIYKSIEKVCQKLETPIESIKAFIDNSEVIQASCMVTGTDETILKMSSKLINLLDEQELEFVIGHEIGHFLLNHGHVEHHGEDNKIEFQDQMNSRYQEISSDRIGLLACGSIKKAISAMLKLITGLDDNHLRFDISAFISQSNDTDNLYSQQSMISSHPSNLVRCRALLWFSMEKTSDLNSLDDSVKKKEIDNRIEDDFKKYIDGPIIKVMQEVKENFKLWMAVKEIIKDGIFDKNEQKIFERMFGRHQQTKIIDFFKAYKNSEIAEIINRNYENSKEDLILHHPRNHDLIIKEVKDDIHSEFKKV